MRKCPGLKKNGRAKVHGSQIVRLCESVWFSIRTVVKKVEGLESNWTVICKQSCGHKTEDRLVFDIG